MVNRDYVGATIIIVVGGRKGTEFTKRQYARNYAKCPTFINSFIPCNSPSRKNYLHLSLRKLRLREEYQVTFSRSKS